MKPIAVAAVIACLGAGVGTYFLVNKPAPSSEIIVAPLPEPIAAAPVLVEEFKLPKGVAPLVAIEAEFKRLEKAIRLAKTDEELKTLSNKCGAMTFDLAEHPALAVPHFSSTAKWFLVGGFGHLGHAAQTRLARNDPSESFAAANAELKKAKIVIAQYKAR